MRIIRDVGYILLSNLITITVSFFYFPLLVKFYGFSSEYFGGFQYIQSTIGVIAAFSGIAMDVAYISERKTHTEEERTNFTTWFFLIAISIQLFSILFWALISKDSSFAVFGPVISISLVFNSVIQLLLRDQKEFRLLSAAIIVQSVANVAFGLIIGFFVRSEATLIFAASLGNVVSGGFLILNKKISFRFSNPDKAFIKKFFRDNYNLLFFQTGSSVLNTFSFNLPVFIIKLLFSDVVLGFYSLAYRLILAVNRVMSQALSQTFLPYFSKSEEDEKMIFKWFPALTFGFYPIYLLISLLSSWYIPLLFTYEFNEVGKIIQILIPWQYSVAVISPYTSSLLVHKKANVTLRINILLLGARVGSLVIGAAFDHRISLLLFSMVSTFFFDIMMVYSHKYAKVKVSKNLLLILILQTLMYSAVLNNVLKWISILPCSVLVFVFIKKRKVITRFLGSIKKNKVR